jgi:hypothetical protein
MKNSIHIQVRVIAILLFILCLLLGCASSKKTKEVNQEKDHKESGEFQSINEVTSSGAIIYRTKPIYYNTVIEKPCDDKGNVNPINATIGSGTNKFRIHTDKGSILIDAFIDSTETSLKEHYRDKFIKDSLYLREKLATTKVVENKTVKVVWPWWLWIAVIGGILFAILWLIEKFDLVTRVRKIIFKI